MHTTASVAVDTAMCFVAFAVFCVIVALSPFLIPVELWLKYREGT